MLSNWNNVNSGGWADVSGKLQPQVSNPDRDKPSVGVKASGHRTAEPMAWTQQSEGKD